MKKVAIIGTVGLPAKYGGFETLAANLVEQLGEKHEMTVYCSSKRYKGNERPATYKQAKLTYIPLEANGISSIFYDSLSILHALFFAEVLLILGVSGAWLLPFVRLFTRKKIIISIDGIEWKREKWGLFAKCYLWWAEKLAVRFSHIDISDNEALQDYTARRYKSLSRVIEYGADHARKVLPNTLDKQRFPFLSAPYAFKVCRIEPENKVGEILKAFSHTSSLPLVVVGNWSDSGYGRNLRNQYEHYPQLHLLDPIYDQRSLDAIRSNAYLYIHGHSAGGTNPSLVEAMYLGLAVITNGVSYNRVTTEGKAIYFHSSEELLAILRDIPSLEVRRIGAQMKEIALRRYTWEIIARKYDVLLEEVFLTREKQSVVPQTMQVSPEILSHHGAAHLQHHKLFFEYK